MIPYRAYPLKTQLSVDREFNRTYTSTFQVITEHTDGPMTVLNSTGVPSRYGVYVWGGDVDVWAFLHSISATPEGDDVGDGTGSGRMRKWIISAVHSSKSDSRDGQQNRDNPCFEPPKIRGSFVKRTVPAYRDRNNKPIVNMAREPILPPFEKDDSFDTLSISFNTPSINLGLRSSYRDSVNSNAMWGLAKRQIKLASWVYSVQWAGGFSFIAHDFEFIISNESHPASCNNGGAKTGFYNTAANMGHAQLISGKQSAILVNDIKKKEPSYLTCAGAVQEPTASNETWVNYEIETEKDFSAIPGLPSVLPGPFV